MARTGVLLAAYGGPRNLDEVGPFMCSIMGTEPTDAAVSDACRRYLTIGGFSPLPYMAERVAVQVERALNGLEPASEPDEGGMGLLGVPSALARAGDVKMPVVVGMLHSEPSIGSAVEALASAGVRTIVVLPLSPFESANTTRAYLSAAEAAAEGVGGVRIVEAARYNTSAKFVEAVSTRLATALDTDEIAGMRRLVVFTAHSLPVDEIERDDAYVEQLRETAAAVAESVGLGPADGAPVLPDIEAFSGGTESAPWLLAFQSKGRRGGEWIGPDLDAVLDAAIAADFECVVVSPIGFALDHMETLYDLDVLAADRVLSADREFARAAAPNDSPELVAALAEAVERVI